MGPGRPPSGTEGAVLGGPAGSQPAWWDEAAQNFCRESQVWTRCSKPLPTVWAAKEHSARCNMDGVTQRRIGINTRPGGPGRRSAATRAEAIAGREQWGSGGQRKPSSAGFTRCAACTGREEEAPAPFPENTASLCHPRVTLSAGEHRHEPSPAVPGETYFPGYSCFYGTVQLRSDCFQL